MSAGIFNIGVSSLNVAQLGLATTEHNIANASTPGYTRQRTVQATNTPLITGSGYVGQGVHVTTVQRLYDSFLSQQVNTAQTTASELDTYSAQIAQIDNILADATAGLTPALQDFFSGVASVATSPSLVSARQLMISSGKTLVARFQSIEGQLSEIYQGVNSQITSTVTSINAYAKQIATLNQNIIVAQAAISQSPNDLLDQRDNLVAELNKLVKVTTTTESNGSVNVFIGNGQQLVVGVTSAAMTAMASSSDPSRITVGLKTQTGVQELPESLITGGSLGGYLSFRNETLDSASNQLGLVATSMALTFNAQYALGQDQQGSIAGDANFVANFFTVPTPKVLASSLNPPGSPEVTVTYDVPTAAASDGHFTTNLTASDYSLDVAGGTLTLIRLSDNKVWTGSDVASLADASGTLLSAEPQGFTIGTPASGFVDGTSYLIQPTRGAASSIGINSTVAADTRLINAAAPIRTLAATANKGGATISAGSVATGYTAPASGSPVTLSYDSATNLLSGFPDGSTLSYTSGSTITFDGISFAISGQPSNGDTFSIQKNVNGTADNRNVLLLGKLQTQSTMQGGTANYQSVYAQLVSDIGNKAQEVLVTGAAQTTLLEQAQSARDSYSAVNLDEEAANLLRYQQAYQASAKMLDIGSKLFDSILAIGA